MKRIPAQGAQLSAQGLALQDSKESGIFASLPPSAFTAILAGKSDGTGIDLVEIHVYTKIKNHWTAADSATSGGGVPARLATHVQRSGSGTERDERPPARTGREPAGGLVHHPASKI